MTQSCRKVLVFAATCLLASAAGADAVFNIWVDAPDEVQAGSTFTASVWAEVSGSVLDESDGGFQGFAADLLASGLDAEFSTATIPFMNIPMSFGTPEPNALRDVRAVNYPQGIHFPDQNPLLLFNVEVTTAPSARGSLELTVAQVQGESAMLGWWVDYWEPVILLDTDLGSSRIITPATVNVIPAPASLGLLAVVGVGAVRRRRSVA